MLRFIGSALVAVLCTGAVMATFVGCGHLPHKAKRDIAADLAIARAEGETLTLAANFRHGSMQVTGTPGSGWHLDAKVTVYADSPEVAKAVASDLVVTTEREGGRVVVRIEPKSKQWTPEEYRLAIAGAFRIPVQTSLDVTTTHGAVRFENLQGTIRARSSHGSITLSRINGDTDVRSTHGAIRVDDLTGSSHSISSTHGSATLAGVTGNLTLTTTHGAVDVDLGLQESGRSEIRTTHGAAVVRLSPESSARVTASTSHGRISCDLPASDSQITKRSGSFVIGAGEADIVLTTSHGAVRIVESAETIGRKAE